MAKPRPTTAEKVGARFIAGRKELIATAKAGGLAAVKASHGIPPPPAVVILGPPAVTGKDVAAARKALELDNELGEAHCVFGFVTFVSDFDWVRAEQEFKRATAIIQQGRHAARNRLALMLWLGR